MLGMGVLRRVRLQSLSAVALRAADYSVGRRRIVRVLRQRARCTRSGHLGATLRHPSLSGDMATGEAPFPAEQISRDA
ncbi:MAG TPA: hypothetical protein VFQ89_01750 [Candidatus Binatia bacterium]|nr:hypothetical protein [Candidatus Binatia bacterium]